MSELDDLMSLDPLSLSDTDIDKIIVGQRAHRQRLATQGGKAKKETGPKTAIDLTALGLIPKPEISSVPRRKL